MSGQVILVRILLKTLLTHHAERIIYFFAERIIYFLVALFWPFTGCTSQAGERKKKKEKDIASVPVIMPG